MQFINYLGRNGGLKKKTQKMISKKKICLNFQTVTSFSKISLGSGKIKMMINLSLYKAKFVLQQLTMFTASHFETFLL
jgi:hypothetical protein